jgi:hypothetical protein
VQAIKDLVLKIKPSAVVSTHTWGRVVLTPYGDSMLDCPDYDQYKVVVSQMAKLSGYRWMRACDMYGVGGILNNPPPKEDELVKLPIHGSEVDWFYRHGAMAIVSEVGTHQRIPTLQDIQTELGLNKQAFYYFIREAPKVQLKVK